MTAHDPMPRTDEGVQCRRCELYVVLDNGVWVEPDPDPWIDDPAVCRGGQPVPGDPVLVQVWSGSNTVALEQECADLDEAEALFHELHRDDRKWPKFDFTINGTEYDTIGEARQGYAVSILRRALDDAYEYRRGESSCPSPGACDDPDCDLDDDDHEAIARYQSIDLTRITYA